MDAQLTTTEINAAREVLQDYAPAKQALATLETHDGRLDTAFDQLWIEKNGSPPFMQDKSLWEVTLEVLRNELCGNDGFRAQVKRDSGHANRSGDRYCNCPLHSQSWTQYFLQIYRIISFGR